MRELPISASQCFSSCGRRPRSRLFHFLAARYGDFPECYYSLSGYPWGLIGIGIDEITLFPVAKRYDGGAPDLGYYYDPLDYSVAAMFVTNKVTVLPGTAIGFRNDDLGGFFLQDGSSFVAQGMATNPIIFTDIEFVQESGRKISSPASQARCSTSATTTGGLHQFACPGLRARAVAGGTQHHGTVLINSHICAKGAPPSRAPACNTWYCSVLYSSSYC